MRTLDPDQQVQPVALDPYTRCVRPEYRATDETAAS